MRRGTALMNLAVPDRQQSPPKKAVASLCVVSQNALSKAAGTMAP
jgi:hypothetical protein